MGVQVWLSQFEGREEMVDSMICVWNLVGFRASLKAFQQTFDVTYFALLCSKNTLFKMFNSECIFLMF